MTLGKAPRRGEVKSHGPRSFEDELNASGDHRAGATDRPSRDRTLMDVAHIIGQRGTCSRAHVGAVLARSGRIIATGYNGAPAGMPHCDHSTDGPITVNMVEPPESFKPTAARLMVLPEGSPFVSGCRISEHAERNAIVYAARYGLSTDRSTLYSTHAPCLDCARAIINAGIIRVCYTIPYRLTEGIELLSEAGVEVAHLPA